MNSKTSLTLLVIIATTLVAFPIWAETEGIYADKIVFGQSACLTGPNSQLGQSYRIGIELAFAEFNDEGGLAGRKLELIVLDDGYEPEQASENAEKFVQDNDVLAVIGGVRTPTAQRIAPILRSADIAFVGHVTGADFLFDVERFPNVTNLRASYLDEVRTLITHIVEEFEQHRIGIIYQDDAFGRAILRDLQIALEEYDLPLLAKTRFSRNTHAVHASLFEIAKADLDAILLIGTYQAISAIINLADSLGHDYTMASLSFSLSREIRQRLNRPNDRLLHTEVMPSPHDETSALAESFRIAFQARSNLAEEYINETALEGYLLGRYVIATLQRMGDTLSREAFVEHLRPAEPTVIDEWVVTFDAKSNQGSEYVRLTTLSTATDSESVEPLITE